MNTEHTDLTGNNDAGTSEPVNDPGGFDHIAEPTTHEEGINETTPTPPEDEVALGVHIMMLGNGGFAMQVTGEANLGEMYMLISRALASVNARIISETVQADMAAAKKVSPILTPGRG